LGLEVGLGANLLGFSLEGMEGMPSKCSLEWLTVHNLAGKWKLKRRRTRCVVEMPSMLLDEVLT
jgi:hypothetical protein